jgi:hypothetical protein
MKAGKIDMKFRADLINKRHNLLEWFRHFYRTVIWNMELSNTPDTSYPKKPVMMKVTKEDVAVCSSTQLEQPKKRKRRRRWV